MLTLSEYLVDYAPAHTAEKGWQLIEKELTGFKIGRRKNKCHRNQKPHRKNQTRRPGFIFLNIKYI